MKPLQPFQKDSSLYRRLGEFWGLHACYESLNLFDANPNMGYCGPPEINGDYEGWEPL